MEIKRRRLLGLIAALPTAISCDLFASPLTKKMKGFAMQAISPEEIELLKNPLTRPAYFASHKLPQGVLEIRQRVFGAERGLLRGADLKDVRFINCSFEGFQGYDNNLDNVLFEECQFFGAVFIGPKWTNVRLARCEAEGPFQIGCANGDVTFEACVLAGMTAKEGGYGNWSDHFGLATGQDGYTTFLKCKIKNMEAGGAKSLKLIECEIGDLSANCRSQRGELVIERCTAKGKQRFAGGGNDFKYIGIRDSQLGEVDLMAASSDVVEIINSSLRLRMGALGTRFQRMLLSKVKFHTQGFSCVLTTIGDLKIDSCEFRQGAALELFGDVNTRPRPGEGPIFWTQVRDFAISNTHVPKAGLSYMQIGSFALENATLGDADLTHGRIGTLSFRQAKLTGSVDLTDTTIRRIENSGLTNTARITGELIAKPDAPEPDLQPERKAEAKNGGKKKPTK